MNLFNVAVDVSEEPENGEIEVGHHHDNEDTRLLHVIKGHAGEELEEDGEYLAGHEEHGVGEVYGYLGELSGSKLHDNRDDGEGGESEDGYENDEQHGLMVDYGHKAGEHGYYAD